jgi:hypothetical protein
VVSVSAGIGIFALSGVPIAQPKKIPAFNTSTKNTDFVCEQRKKKKEPKKKKESTSTLSTSTKYSTSTKKEKRKSTKEKRKKKKVQG